MAAEETLRAAGCLPQSIQPAGAAVVGLRAGASGWQLLAWAPRPADLPAGLAGAGSEAGGGVLVTCPADAGNAGVLRAAVPWLRPQLVGPRTSVGTGDRLGTAAPGQVAAFRANPGLRAVLAQQSARELSRTGRTFADVLDAATFGALASGWTDGYGADADHLKTTAEIDSGIAAGFTMFTADPIELVPKLPADAPVDDIEAAYAQIPWAALEDTESAFLDRYPTHIEIESGALSLAPALLRAAAARFGPAVVQVVSMHRHLAGRVPAGSFEFEVAVDEIEHETTAVDHVYLATELQRLGVSWVSFAPRFVGRFEKGIDYLGDAAALEADVRRHADIADHFGGYKISVHSGSDKFSVYEAIAGATRGRVHLKTSGTSYLVAVGTLAEREPALTRRVWGVALEAYATARASYHVSAALGEVPDAESVRDDDLPGLLDRPDTREILHVGYGAVLHGAGGGSLGSEVREAIWRHRDEYWEALAAHIGRHVAPFARRASE